MVNENRRADHLERHVMTIICSLTAIGVIWIGASIIDLKTVVAGLSEKFALRSELNALQVEVSRIGTEQVRRSFIIEGIKKNRE